MLPAGTTLLLKETVFDHSFNILGVKAILAMDRLIDSLLGFLNLFCPHLVPVNNGCKIYQMNEEGLHEKL